ncbi:MAG: ECF transporter S component [Clostridia bacterium]|nr:ECF transporter S component [Clostridia bacterium]
MTKRNDRTFKLVAIALFTAVAYIFGILPSIKVNFLSLDIKDAFITIAALYFGPLSGVLISAVVSILEMLFGSTTGFYGMIMNFFGSAAFSAVASLIYKNKKSLCGAVIALACASLGMTAVMVVANLIFTPYYMGVSIQTVKDLIVPLFLPFNLVKGILNSALVMLLYKHVSLALKRTGYAGRTDTTTKLNKNTFIVAVIAIIIVALSLAFIFVKLGGAFVIES